VARPRIATPVTPVRIRHAPPTDTIDTMAKFEYPHTPEQNAARSMLGGPPQDIPGHVSSQFDRVNAQYGSGDLDSISKSSASAAPISFPTASRSKKEPLYDKSQVTAALSQPSSLKTIRPTDPRQLHATQPGITRDGVEYYMGDEYNNTGATFADKGNPGNLRPVVYNKNNGQSLLLSGHHRAQAANLQGRQFDAQHIDEPNIK
jgi:hypothetical protein